MILDDDEVTIAKRLKRKEREEAPYRRNNRRNYGHPTTDLEPIEVLKRLLQDPARRYLGKLCHMEAWQFFILADRLKPLIERPRLRPDYIQPDKKGHDVHFDHYHRLFFCLEWLNSGTFYHTREATYGWSKTSLQEDNLHVLRAIVEGLEDQLQWPDAARRAELAGIHDGIFSNMIGILDIKEHRINKPKDRRRENLSYSSKHKMNSYKNLSIIDYTGRFIFVLVALGKNDREFWTQCPLYLQKGLYFCGLQYVASDGGFHGDGPVKFSYDNPGNDPVKKAFNLVFREVRTGIETAFARICVWFPILGTNKGKWNYSEETLQLSVHAAARLHNWLMNTENLSYSAVESPESYFKSYY